MTRGRSHFGKTLLRILIGVLLLAWIFHVIFRNEARQLAQQEGIDWTQWSRGEQWEQAWTHGPSALWQTLSLVPPGILAVSLLLMGLTILLGVARWSLALQAQGLVLGGRRALEISLVAHFFNSFLLGSTGGDLMKAYYAAREARHKKTEAVLTVFVDRLVGLWAMLLFAGMMLIPNVPLIMRSEPIRILALVMVAMLGTCTILVVVAFYGGVSRGWAGARVWLRRLPKGEWLERSLDSCRRFGKTPGFLVRTTSLSMALNFMAVLQVQVLSRGLGESVPFMAMLAIVPMIICLSAIPITPSGLGVRENLFVLTLATPALGVPATAALSLSLLTFAGSLFWSLMGGAVYLGLKQRHHLDDKELAVPGAQE